jgi:hypothetical protein
VEVAENSWWTWTRGDGAPYAAGAVPALWRRVADRRWQVAKDDFGWVEDYAQLDRLRPGAASRQNDSDWKLISYRLKAMAKLWQPSPEEPAIYQLGTFNPLQHEAANALRVTLGMAAQDGDLAVRLDDWTLRIVPRSLRGYLLMTCAADVAAHQRFRRCIVCNEWFPIQRTDARHCSNACRQAAHVANKEVS